MFTAINEIKVSLNFSKQEIPVGRLALNNSQIYFEYDGGFLNGNLQLSPLKLPLQAGLHTFDRFLFEGLPGLFYDSLPDGWGRLLLDRCMRLQGILPNELSPLDRLAHVGNLGMGALAYYPAHNVDNEETAINLNQLASDAEDVLSGGATDVLQELLSLNGSSAGARPKAMIGVDTSRKNIIHDIYPKNLKYEAWIVKFQNSQDDLDAGAIEYVYALMAKQAGITMTGIHLFPANNNPGYFATKRFDRNKGQRIHTHSACGLLHSDFRTPSLDYEDLLALTQILTRDIREVEKMFRQAVFNVLAHNRDDHAKNFSFLMDETGEWRLSPAYDLTFSAGPRGEQSTMVMGEGKSPTKAHLIKLGLDAKLKHNKINTIIEQTQHALNQWQTLAKQHDIHPDNIKLITQRMRIK